jgi:tetratricopeptide (TPR) repeat protein
MAWAVANDQGEVALRMIEAFWRFWHFHGDLSAGRRWADQALALPSGNQRTDARAKALIGRGSLAYWQNDTAAALLDYEDALSILEAIGDPAGIAEGRYNLAFVQPMRGDVDRAIELFRSCLATFRELGDRRGSADALFGLAVMSRLRGDLAIADSSAAEALVVHQDLGDVFGFTGDMYVLGRVAAETGDLDTARRRFLETLDNMAMIQERTGIALILDNLANLANLGDRPIDAMRLAGAADAVKEFVGGEAPPELIHLPDPRVQAWALLSDEEIDAAHAEGRAMSLEEALAYARREPR